MKQAKKKARKLTRRVRDYGTMKPLYPGQYHQPGSYKK